MNTAETMASLLVQDTKQCRGCGETKPGAEFRVKSQGKSRLVLESHCRPCARERQRVWNMTRQYGPEGPYLYDRLLAQQNGSCAACDVREADNGRRGIRFHIDHDHNTGKIRGLLCHSCNLALGHAQDDPGRLRAMADYLERSP